METIDTNHLLQGLKRLVALIEERETEYNRIDRIHDYVHNAEKKLSKRQDDSITFLSWDGFGTARVYSNLHESSPAEKVVSQLAMFGGMQQEVHRVRAVAALWKGKSEEAGTALYVAKQAYTQAVKAAARAVTKYNIK